MTDLPLGGRLAPRSVGSDLCQIGYNDQSALTHATNWTLTPATHDLLWRIDSARVVSLRLCEKDYKVFLPIATKIERAAPNYRRFL